MALILLWLGGLSFAGCIIWATLSGLTIEVVLATLASVLVAGIGFRYTGSTRRLKGLEHLGYVYLMVGIFAGLGSITINELFNTLTNGAVYAMGLLMASGFWLARLSRRRMKESGLLFDLRRADTLPGPAALQGNIKFEGYEIAGLSPSGGPSLSQRGRIFLEHEAQLPCVIRAKAGSVSVYEISTYRTWVEGKGSLWRESYNHNPFRVPRRIKPASHVQAAILQELGELVPRLSTISQEFKSNLIELKPERFSLLLKKYELSREEMSDACVLLPRITALIDEHFK